MARKMKDSGIEWIGEIPEGWEVTKIKHIVSSVTDIDHFMPDSVESGIPYLMIGNLKDLSSSIDWDSSKRISIEDYKKLSIKSRPQKGDIIFARYASIGTTCYIDTDRDFLVSYACLTIHPSDLIIGKFLSYYLKSSSFAEDVLRRTNSNTQGNVGKDSLVNATIVLPSIIEQTQIVNFLEAKCSDINAMLSKTRSSIEEYKKLKQAVITQAVPKGVRGEREMKDSGIEWIGEIPVEWNITKIKSGVTKIGSGKTPSGGAETYTDSGVIFLRSQNVYDCTLNLESPTYISHEVDATMKSTRVLPDDVLLNITGGSIGRCSIVPKTLGLANVNQHVCIIRTNPLIFLPKYMQYFWVSALGHLAIDLYQTGGNREGMSADAIRNTPIPYAPLTEQKEIAAYLDTKCAEIDGLIAKKEQLVKELESYKKSLIYEVVTGKREV